MMNELREQNDKLVGENDRLEKIIQDHKQALETFKYNVERDKDIDIENIKNETNLKMD